MRGGSEWLQGRWTRGDTTWWLAALAALYGFLVRLRGQLFRLGLRRSVRLPVPVIVVGNVVAGGAGKTPTVLALVRLLIASGHVPGIVSRGYGGDAPGPLAVEPDTPPGRCGDEALLLRRRSGVPVFIGRDRVAATQALLHVHPTVDVIVSDDGRQHLRLGRDAEILVFDERGAGNGRLLPAGPLREPMPTSLPPRTLVGSPGTELEFAL